LDAASAGIDPVAPAARTIPAGPVLDEACGVDTSTFGVSLARGGSWSAAGGPDNVSHQNIASNMTARVKTIAERHDIMNEYHRPTTV